MSHIMPTVHNGFHAHAESNFAYRSKELLKVRERQLVSGVDLWC
jgi:hypothetical protein